jgi:hypothetical protein
MFIVVSLNALRPNHLVALYSANRFKCCAAKKKACVWNATYAFGAGQTSQS